MGRECILRLGASQDNTTKTNAII